MPARRPGAKPDPGSGRLALAFVAFTALTSTASIGLSGPVGARPQARPAPAELPGAEGPLANDTYLPVVDAAAERLARGDRLLSEILARDATAGARPDPALEGTWTALFEAWRGALSDSATGDAVPPRPSDGLAAEPGPWGDPDGTAGRRVEGVEAAVAWRVDALPGAARDAWIARFDPPAAAALAAAAGPEGWAAVERSFPRTPSAARAAILMADSRLELGRTDAARTWCARGFGHISSADMGGGNETAPHAALRTALLARRSLCDGLERAATANRGSAGLPAVRGEREPWRTARGLVSVEVRAFPAPREAGLRQTFDSGRARGPELGGGVQPGMALLDADLLALQRADRMLWLNGRSATVVYERRWSELLGAAGVIVRTPHAERAAPGWRMDPATDGQVVVAVHGRAEGSNANALVCFGAPPPVGQGGPGGTGATGSGSGGSLGVLGLRDLEGPGVRWIVHGERTLDADGHERPWPPELAGLLEPDGEFQPGPVVVGDLVLVQVRRGGLPAGAPSLSGHGVSAQIQVQIQSWLVAFDLATGLPRWKRYLARGVELSRDLGRMSLGTPLRTAGQPLVAAGGRVFAGTHLGAGALVEAADGRLITTVLSRRRSSERPGWTGWTGWPSSPSSSRRSAGSGPAAAVIPWAPADGDHLYWIDARAEIVPQPGPAEGASGEPAEPRNRLGPPTGGPFLHPPRPIGEALGLLGGDRDEALVLSRAGARRTLSAWDAVSGGRLDALFLAPGEEFTGSGALSAERALLATDRGVYLFDRSRELSLVDYEPLEGAHAPRGRAGGDDGTPGGDVHARGDRIYVVGRDAVWVLGAE